MEPHLTSPERVNYEKTDGQWYTHDNVDIKQSQLHLKAVALSVSMKHTLMH